MERTEQEVRHFVIDTLTKYVSNYSDFAEERDMVANIAFSIGAGEKLTKSEAALLEKILGDQLKDDMIQALKKDGMQLILEADVQSIYADAWGVYCRSDRLINAR